MPGASLSRKIAEISKELEALRTKSLNNPERAAEIFQDSLGELQVCLKELTYQQGGHDEGRAQCFC
jgi:hypothetical protein